MLASSLLALARGLRGPQTRRALAAQVPPPAALSERCCLRLPSVRTTTRLLSSRAGAGTGTDSGNGEALPASQQQRVEPELKESDLQESFVKGSGKGGQKINKVRNCVLLTHLPSGLQVRCQKTRSLDGNRRAARKLLLQKLDDELNGSLSQRSRKIERLRRKKAGRRARAKQKYAKQQSSSLETEDGDGADGEDASSEVDAEEDEEDEVDVVEDAAEHSFKSKRRV